MDKALDEIITSRPRGIRRGSSRRNLTAKQQIVGRAITSPTAKAAKAAAASKPAASQPTADKIIVSNLPQDVNEAQIKELFHSTVGPVRELTLHFDANGRSKGVAAVQFQQKGDGNKAYQQYNNRLIDGKRPMKIEIVVDPSKPSQTLAARVAPAAAAANAIGAVRGTGAARGGRRGRGGRPRKAERTPKTAADLDAEMEDYTATTATPAS
ncbi:hypothetical protein CPB85DRAFT_1280930 [Mucidula mucida]|nr:hypothetical protein CPB85DRAFT_1280930 [Mucidula mucida]